MIRDRVVPRGRPAVLLIGSLLLLSLHLRAVAQAAAGSAPPTQSYLVYAGTYSLANSKGIYNYRYDPKSGQLTPIGVAAQIANPSFLATDPQHRYLYAVTEMGLEPGASDYKKNGSISSYSIDRKTGALKFLNKV